MTERIRCKDLVGRTVRLTRDVTVVSGRIYRKGSVFRVDRTWRGKFTLSVPIDTEPGGYEVPVIRQVRRHSFEVVTSPTQEQPHG